jgi:SRSO17 transposase
LARGRRLDLLLKEVSCLNPNKCYLIIDDVLTHKTGKHIEEVGRYKDHTNNSYTLGHVLVTSHHLSVKGGFPIGLRLYKQLEDKKDPEFSSKIDLAKELIKETISLDLRSRTVVFDRWYFSKELTDFIEGPLKAGWQPAKAIVFLSSTTRGLP